MSRIGKWSIIESTLREGEQFVNTFYDTQQKIEIAKMLDDFGVEYIELTSPAASPQSFKDCQTIAKLGLKCKTLTHTRCTMEDAKLAVEAGVDGIDVLFGTSSILREFSHGKDMDYIIEKAKEVINYIKSQGKEVRFSSEDSFRSNLVDLLNVYQAVDRIGVNRVGVADTVGVASPRQTYELVRTLRQVVSCDIEFHGHNDTGCAIANSYAALEAGATHIDTTVLGIGERNGITPLGGFIARMYANDADLVKKKYKLHKLRDIENYIADTVNVQVPFNNCITGYSAFSHKAGIHVKALLNNPATYEILKPEDFGMTRYVHVAHRLTGWNAIKARSDQLNLKLSDAQVKKATEQIKALADIRHKFTINDVDEILHEYERMDDSKGTDTRANYAEREAASEAEQEKERKEAEAEAEESEKKRNHEEEHEAGDDDESQNHHINGQSVKKRKGENKIEPKENGTNNKSEPKSVVEGET